jgi:hypothetical protein
MKFFVRIVKIKLEITRLKSKIPHVQYINIVTLLCLTMHRIDEDLLLN